MNTKMPVIRVVENIQISLALTVLLLLGTGVSLTKAFATRTTECRKNAFRIKNNDMQSNDNYRENFRRDTFIYSIKNDGVMPDRRELLKQSSLLAGATIVSTASAAWNIAPGVAQAADSDKDFKVLKTDSGLKYIELEEGTIGYTSKTPQYGQLCVFSYIGYLQLPPDNDLKKFASQKSFVHKHGNGKLIAGLDEGLHSMKRGGRRRLIIPPKLGFVTDGLGPIPEMPWQRETLNFLLQKMVAQRGGNLVYDIQLERFFDDEADQGYYQDDEISPEEFAELNRRLNRKNSAVDSVGETIEVTDRDKEKPIV